MKKVKSISIVVCLLGIFLVVNTVHAELFNRGTDSLGNQLIYDSDLNITWYDYTRYDSWANQMAWADELSVTFDGVVYNDWRLPKTVDGPYTNAWDCTGTATAGYNVTTSELGHLFYVESDNLGFYDTSCNETDAWILYGTGMGEFVNWQTGSYWSSTEYATTPSEAWYFNYDSGSGRQATGDKTSTRWGMAVRAGDVAVVPEPISSTLFIVGGVTLGFRRWRKK